MARGAPATRQGRPARASGRSRSERRSTWKRAKGTARRAARASVRAALSPTSPPGGARVARPRAAPAARSNSPPGTLPAGPPRRVKAQQHERARFEISLACGAVTPSRRHRVAEARRGSAITRCSLGENGANGLRRRRSRDVVPNAGAVGNLALARLTYFGPWPSRIAAPRTRARAAPVRQRDITLRGNVVDRHSRPGSPARPRTPPRWRSRPPRAGEDRVPRRRRVADAERRARPRSAAASDLASSVASADRTQHAHVVGRGAPGAERRPRGAAWPPAVLLLRPRLDTRALGGDRAGLEVEPSVSITNVKTSHPRRDDAVVGFSQVDASDGYARRGRAHPV